MRQRKSQGRSISDAQPDARLQARIRTKPSRAGIWSAR